VDWSTVPCDASAKRADQLAWQSRLLRALWDGWARLDSDEAVLSGLFLDGCYQLIRGVRMPAGGSRLLNRLVGQHSIDAIKSVSTLTPFEALELAPRRALMCALRIALSDWPQNLIENALIARFSLNDLRGDRGQLPYWLDRQGKDHLDHSWHHTTADEKDSAIRFLERHGMTPGKMEVKVWIGLATPAIPNGSKGYCLWSGQRNLCGFSTRDEDRWRAYLAAKLASVLTKYCHRIAFAYRPHNKPFQLSLI
jgi:hypothetical protein